MLSSTPSKNKSQAIMGIVRYHSNNADFETNPGSRLRNIIIEE